MPAVSYTVSNIGRRNEPPRHQIQEPYQYQDHGYGSVNRDPYQYQDRGYGNNDPYQDHGYGSVNRDPYQNQGYGYGTVNNRDPYQDHGYGSANRNPYHHDHGYGSVINNPPPYMPFPREQSLESDSIEWNETPEAHVYTAHLPGAKRSDLGVEVDEDRMLLITCYKGVDESSGHHMRDVHRLMLPDDSNIGQVSAYMENGVLTVTVPKLNRFVNRYGRNFNMF